jgi:hypothetical protein
LTVPGGTEHKEEDPFPGRIKMSDIEIFLRNTARSVLIHHRDHEIKDKERFAVEFERFTKVCAPLIELCQLLLADTNGRITYRIEENKFGHPVLRTNVPGNDLKEHEPHRPEFIEFAYEPKRRRFGFDKIRCYSILPPSFSHFGKRFHPGDIEYSLFGETPFSLESFFSLDEIAGNILLRALQKDLIDEATLERMARPEPNKPGKNSPSFQGPVPKLI